MGTYASQTEELLPGTQANQKKMDSLKSATLKKADGSTVDAATALQQKRIGAPLVEGLHQCWPNSTRKLRSLEWRSSLSQETRAKMPFSYMKESHGDWLAVGF